MLKKFHELTDCPVIVNTSFNLSWEPIVLTPREAYHTFMQSAMDVLVLEDFVLYKGEQPLGVTPWASVDGERSEPGMTRPLGADVLGAEPAAFDLRTRALAIPRSTPWADPTSGAPLVVTQERAFNPVTGAFYPVEEGIPRLYVPTDSPESNGRDVTELVKQFYESTPFPTTTTSTTCVRFCGYEGLVAKDEVSPYEGGPTRRWLKVKQKNWTVEGDGWRRRFATR